MTKQTMKKSTRKYSKREETVIDNKSSTLDKEQYKIQSREIKNKPTVNVRLKFKKELVNKVCTQYAYGKECKYGDPCKFINKRICKTYA